MPLEGDADQCQQKCRALVDCAGFVRVGSNDKCFFLFGKLETLESYSQGARDCYESISIGHDVGVPWFGPLA